MMHHRRSEWQRKVTLGAKANSGEFSAWKFALRNQKLKTVLVIPASHLSALPHWFLQEASWLADRVSACCSQNNRNKGKPEEGEIIVYNFKAMFKQAKKQASPMRKCPSTADIPPTNLLKIPNFWRKILTVWPSTLSSQWLSGPLSENSSWGFSLVVQQLRIPLPMQGTQVCFLFGEQRSNMTEAIKAAHHS